MREKSKLDSNASQPEPAQQNVEWDGLPARLSQVIACSGLNQTELARQLGVSSGFMSEVARGVKRPGAEFFLGVRKLLGVSIDWLMAGEGSMTGGSGIRLELLQAIRLQIAVARAAVIDDEPLAKALLILIREGKLSEASQDKSFGELLERISPNDPDANLSVELYNGHLWASDPITQRRNLLAAAVAHFEARKPIDKMAALTGAQAPTAKASNVQITMGTGHRIAGGAYIEVNPRRRGK